MALFAINKNQDRVRASQVINKDMEFTCEDCGNPMSFVDAQLKVKHFRHKVASDCGDEPETEAHEYYKDLISNRLEMLRLGQVFPEHRLGRKRVDVYLKRDNKRSIAFEVQATNYSFSKYEYKINCYAARRLLVVYMFVGSDFFNEVKNNIYSLKEIEKRIFCTKPYLDSVVGSYLDGETITVPAFKQKFAKGASGYCTDRFILDYRNLRKMRLDDFLLGIQNHKVNKEYLPACSHTQQLTEKSTTKQERYKYVCACCGKFIKWIPDKVALSLGLSFNMKQMMGSTR